VNPSWPWYRVAASAWVLLVLFGAATFWWQAFLYTLIGVIALCSTCLCAAIALDDPAQDER
jgi:hypothetical protein